MDSVAVIGSPSRLGGADTELAHQIVCWQRMGIKVHICHTGTYDQTFIEKYKNSGCVIHEPRDWQSLKGLHAISFCNGEFLKELPEIKKFVRSTTFVNCMTWNFDSEIKMHAAGLIDFHLYQTKHGYDKVSLKLVETGVTYRPITIKPFFDTSEFKFIQDRPTDAFRFGRISRADADKFGESQLWIYDTMTAPVPKAGLILGWCQNVENKFKRKPDSYIAAMPVGWMPQYDFYRFCDAVIMTTDTFENLPRVGFEAMAAGSVLVVDNKGGWKLQVDDGVTGWLCDDNREFVYKASRLAFETKERLAMRDAARAKLDKEWGYQASADSWSRVFEQWDAI